MDSKKGYIAIHEINKRLDEKYEEENIVNFIDSIYSIRVRHGQYPFRRENNRAATIALKQSD